MKIPKKYIPIQHNPLIDFVDLNGSVIPIKMEKPRRDVAKFKYHIPYLIINAFRVELTNYHSDFKEKNFQWDAELHYSQGKKRAAVYKFDVTKAMLDEQFRKPIEKYINEMENQLFSFNDFQKVYCKTTEQREASREIGPYELLENVRNFIDCLIIPSERNTLKTVDSELIKLPNAIIVGYYLLQQLVKRMGEKVDGCDNKKKET